jgi:hypothetical protein
MISTLTSYSTVSAQSSEIYTLPVVVHIIYTDSAYTNISDEQVFSAIDALNDDFRKVYGTQGYGTGVDTEIEFCLASQIPWGDETNGIVRYHCVDSCAMGYDTLGMNRDSNELHIKNLSRWPVEDYINIWVVHKFTGDLAGESGFASIPYGPYGLDGITVLYTAFGIGNEFTVLDSLTNLNRTITHEMGHYLNLLDTYHGDNEGADCPDNTDCGIDGDKCCDTRPHKRSNGACTPNQECGQPAPIENYMDNSSEACRNSFTECQKERMRFYLEITKHTLFNSVACHEPCEDVYPFFVYTNLDGNLPHTVYFSNYTNPMTGLDGFNWYLDKNFVSDEENMSYTFDHYGTYEVCLDAFIEDECISRYCGHVCIVQGSTTSSGTCDCTTGNLISNPLFENYSSTPYPANSSEAHTLDPVDDWTDLGHTTPFYCHYDDIDYVGGLYKHHAFPFSAADHEKIYHSNINLLSVSNKFGFACVRFSVQKRYESVPSTPFAAGIYLNYESIGLQSGHIIFRPNQVYDYPSTAGYYGNTDYACFPPASITDPDLDLSLDWNIMSGPFRLLNIIENEDYHVVLGSSTINTITNLVYFDEVCLLEDIGMCEGELEIEFQVDECNVNFTARSTSSNDTNPTFFWDFGDGSPWEDGGEVNNQFLVAGDYRVCVTMMCGLFPITRCITVSIIEPDCDHDCEEATIPGNTMQCNNGKYFTSDRMTLPSGMGELRPCNPDGQFMFSPGGRIEILDWHVDGEFLYYSFNFIPKNPNFTQDFDIYVKLCDEEGNAVCFVSNIKSLNGSKCQSCDETTIVSQPECNTSRSSNELFEYDGEFEITIPSGYSLCEINTDGVVGVVSTLSGFEITDQSGGTFSYKVSTTNKKQIKGDVMLVFCKEEGEEILTHCVKLAIEVLVVCERYKEPKERISSTEDEFSSMDVFYKFTNPATDLAYIETNEELNDLKVHILDIHGRQVLQQPLHTQSATIEVSGIPGGLYLIQFRKGYNILKTDKIIIIR